MRSKEMIYYIANVFFFFLFFTFKVEHEKSGFKWNSKTQNDVLGAFFIFHWLTQLPGGILAARYGTKLVFGLSNFIACITCMLIPIVAYLDFHAMIILRVVQGIVAGAAWPGKKLFPPNFPFID